MPDTDPVFVAPSNREQLRAWDGDEGAYWAANADAYDRAVAAHHRALLESAAIGEGDRVLDIGCGTGQTTRDAGRAAPRGSALGVDLSAAMLDCARQRAADEGLGNVRFDRVDAQVHPFETGGFDVLISRAGSMFFGDPDAAFANLALALRPGGRIVLVTWQPMSENEWIREFSSALAAGRDLPRPPIGAPGPFALADPDRIHATLGPAGFEDVRVDEFRAGMVFGRDADDAHRFVAGQLGWMLEGLDDGGRARALDALRSTMHDHQGPEGVVFASAAWVVTASRRAR